MSQAIFYLTYNGIYNFTNGIGTQTELLLRGLESLQDQIRTELGPMAVHVVCPQPNAHTWGFDPALFAHQQKRLAALGGTLHLLPYTSDPTRQELWDVRSWRTLSANAADLLSHHVAAYDRVLLICVDQPWLHVPYYARRNQPRPPQVATLLVLYNTAYIRNWITPDDTEVRWERRGLAASRPASGVYIADVCPSFTAHLQAHFPLAEACFAPYTSSILVDDAEFQPLAASEVQHTLERYAIPRDRDLILAFGRATPLKGFERLIPALAPLRERCHLVLISVPYGNDDPQQRLYDRLLVAHRLHATHIKHFTRELPRALCQWPRTRIVAMPSQQETFSNIVLEVALWAKTQGPVIVASHVGGFADQIVPGSTGFFMDTGSPEAITRTLARVLALPEEAHATIRHNAYQRVIQHYDFRQNFLTTLRWFWGGVARHPPGGPPLPEGRMSQLGEG